MAPPPGRLGGAVKMPVQVRMFPEEIAMVDAFAAALSQQSYGAAFSRAEALRIAAMEWLKARQARQAPVPPTPPQHAREAVPEFEAAAVPADTAPGPGVPPPAPPAGPPSRQAQILAALTAAGPQGLRPAEVRQATGVPQGTVASALHGLVQRGQVRRVHDRYVATEPERSSRP
jgi:MarR family